MYFLIQVEFFLMNETGCYCDMKPELIQEKLTTSVIRRTEGLVFMNETGAHTSTE